MGADRHPLVTTTIGSWPKPDWLSSLDHHLSGWRMDHEWLFEGEALRLKQDEATAWAISEQEQTGVDIVTDGEQRRDNYIYYFCRRLPGFDFDRRTELEGRSGASRWPAPTITGPVGTAPSFLAADYRFVRDRTDRRIKVTIPGPLTIADSAIDEYYGDGMTLALELAAAIRAQVQALADAGCDLIQVDEPVFARYPEKVSEYGIRALDECFLNVPGVTKIVHICGGYPSEGYKKAELGNYALIGPMLADSAIDQVSIEAANRLPDLGAIRQFGDKSIVLGLVDVGDPSVESVEHIEARIWRALEHIQPDCMLPAPDCGMIYLRPEVATAKLTNLVEATKKVRRAL